MLSGFELYLRWVPLKNDQLAPKPTSSGSALKETPLTRIKDIELKKPRA